MRKKLTLLFLISALPFVANAQWKIGLTGGVTYNVLTRDTHYMVDWHYENAGGWTSGVFGQYNFNDWLGLRSEVNWTMKSYRQYRTGLLNRTNYKTNNHYLQIPLMLSFSFGDEKIRGFFNVGAYGGYWLSSINSGSYSRVRAEPDKSNIIFDEISGSWENSFHKERDNRIDYGVLGGLGADWRVSRIFSVLAEARCYYSISSFQKEYMKIRDPRYNTTFTIQIGICYHF